MYLGDATMHEFHCDARPMRPTECSFVNRVHATGRGLLTEVRFVGVEHASASGRAL
jgi:hypothetical protein